MARIRSVKPGYFTSLDTAGQLTRETRLHFIGLWTYADDEGRGVDDPRLLKAAIWPLDDDITGDHIEAMQDELDRCGRLIRYRGPDGRRYFEITGWGDHQKPNRPQESAYPTPRDEGSVTLHGTLSEDALPEGRGGERSRRGLGGERERDADASPPAPQPDDHFEDFWTAYPRGRAGKPGGDGSKKKARQRWRNLTHQQREQALAAVANYRAHVEAPDGPYACHATTWLNEERWEQWLEPANGNGHRSRGLQYADRYHQAAAAALERGDQR